MHSRDDQSTPTALAALSLPLPGVTGVPDAGPRGGR